jgi:streptogramin lyase
VAKWEEPAGGSAHLKNPLDIALERDGDLLISDAGRSQVLRFTSKGEFLGSIGTPGGNAPGQFGDLRNVAVDVDGNIVACDMRTGPPRVQVFNPAGKLLHAFAQKGIGPGQIMQPHDLAFDPTGRLFVADDDNMRVNVYTKDGSFIEAWHRNGVRPGELNEPYGVVIDKNGDVFVPNYYGPCQKFTNKGEFLFAFAQPDPPKGPVAITSATGDQWGNVFLATRDTAGLVQNSVDPEPKPVRMLKFNNNGDLIASFPLWDDERGENTAAVDDHDRLYVLFKRADKTGVAIFEPR